MKSRRRRRRSVFLISHGLEELTLSLARKRSDDDDHDEIKQKFLHQCLLIDIVRSLFGQKRMTSKRYRSQRRRRSTIGNYRRSSPDACVSQQLVFRVSNHFFLASDRLLLPIRATAVSSFLFFFFFSHRTTRLVSLFT
jgi:hypothetical protein